MFGFGVKVPEILAKDVVAQMNQDAPPFILDVRTTGEFRGGHIPGAQLIPLGELGRRTAEIPTDRRVVTVCRSGSRSLMAARQLKKLGFDVYNMTGGMMAWTGQVAR